MYCKSTSFPFLLLIHIVCLSSISAFGFLLQAYRAPPAFCSSLWRLPPDLYSVKLSTLLPPFPLKTIHWNRFSRHPTPLYGITFMRLTGVVVAMVFFGSRWSEALMLGANTGSTIFAKWWSKDRDRRNAGGFSGHRLAPSRAVVSSEEKGRVMGVGTVSGTNILHKHHGLWELEQFLERIYYIHKHHVIWPLQHRILWKQFSAPLLLHLFVISIDIMLL
jgi:hypothetical protein